MANWKDTFSPLSLRRGKDLQRAHCVISLKKDDPYYSAKIYDSCNSYYSSLRVEDGEADRFDCNCQTFRNNGNCKHIAALLYAIEEEYPEDLPKEEEEKMTESSSQKQVKLTFEDDGRNHYLDFGDTLEKYRVTQKVYDTALEIVKDKRVYITEITIYRRAESSYLEYNTNVSYAAKRAEVCIKLGHNGIMEMECRNSDSWYFRDTYISKACGIDEPDKNGKIKLCIHKTAALLSLFNYLRENRDIIDYSDRKADMLITNFKKERRKPVEESVPSSRDSVVDIESSIVPSSRNLNSPDITLTINKDGGKYYKVKDIEKLKETIEQKGEHVLGKNNTIDFASASLTDRALKTLEFIRKAEIEIILRTRGDYTPGHLRESISFLNNIDTFFTIYEKTAFLLNGAKLIVGCRESEPTFNMKISEIEKGGETVGIHVTGEISGKYESEKYTYWFQDGYLNRTEKSKLGSAGSLSDIAEDDGSFSFDVGMKLIDNFYQRVLPELRKYGRIEDDAFDKVENKLQEAPSAIFYLSVKDGKIICKAVIKQGDEELTVAPHFYNSTFDTKFTGLESEIREVMEEYNLNLSYLDDEVWTLNNNDNSIYNFLHSGIPELMDIGTVNATDDVKKMIVKKMPQVTSTIDIDEKDDSVLNFVLDTGGLSIEDLVAILNSYNAKKKFHRLKNGDFISFEGMNLDALRDLFFSSGIPLKDFVAGKMHLPLYRALYLDQILQSKNGISLEGGQKYRRLIKEFKTINESDYEIPSSLSDTMRPYQKDGLRWMRVLFDHGFGGILADDMGLGKTIQALSLILSFKEEKKECNTLIISPASLVYNWKAECARFTPSLKAVAVAGTKNEREALIKDHASYDILITSYDLLKRDIELYEGIKFDIEIIDEAQFIKNHNTAQAKAVRAVSSKHRLALTGTPIENRLLELWSIFEYLMPGFLFSQENFKRYISNPIEKSSDKDAAERLKKLTGPFILRRIKSDVLKDLPEKIEETRVTPLEGEQKKLYTAEVAKTMGMLKKSKDFNGQKIEILAELTRIRQICCDPSLVFDSYKGESAKREAVLDLISSAIDGGHKILLFSQFTSMLSLLEKDLKEKEINYYKITGDTGKAKRLELVDAFNSDTTPLFLISLKAGGTGLNLTSADIVIHYDPWWNVAVQNQATDRAHRIGQTKRVTVYKMICENTIEEKIVKLQETKKNLADEIVSGDNVSLSSLSKEDLMELLDISQMV